MIVVDYTFLWIQCGFQVISALLGVLIVIHRKKAIVAFRGWWFMLLACEGALIYTISHASTKKDESGNSSGYDGQAIDFAGDIGQSLFYAAIFVRCFRLYALHRTAKRKTVLYDEAHTEELSDASHVIISDGDEEETRNDGTELLEDGCSLFASGTPSKAIKYATGIVFTSPVELCDSNVNRSSCSSMSSRLSGTSVRSGTRSEVSKISQDTRSTGSSRPSSAHAVQKSTMFDLSSRDRDMKPLSMLLVLFIVGVAMNVFGFWRSQALVYRILDTTLYTIFSLFFITSFLAFAIVLYHVNDVFRQSAELFWLAVTGLLFAAMDIYMFISDEKQDWMQYLIIFLTVLPIILNLGVPLLMLMFQPSKILFPRFSQVSHSVANNPLTLSQRLIDVDSPLIDSVDALLLSEELTACFHTFLSRQYCLENLLFYCDVKKFRLLSESERPLFSLAMYSTYFDSDSIFALNVPGYMVESLGYKILPHGTAIISAFDEIAEHIYQLLSQDSYPRFIASKDFLSISRKLESRYLLAAQF